MEAIEAIKAVNSTVVIPIEYNPTYCIVICPYCTKKHKHGTVFLNYGHRLAQCLKGGYWIQPTYSLDALTALTALTKKHSRH